MSAKGKFTVVESDDARYHVGQTYGVLLNADQSYNEVEIVEPEVIPAAEA